MRKFIKLALFLFIFLTVNVPCATADSVMKGEFGSMQDCLESIKASAGKISKFITNKPDEVTGRLSNGKMFACEIKETGSKGIYYEGWFMVER